ncbi:hypothetical protein ASPVEDRAFT_132573 [Aspergillus versicolor CBS 583.65]|uniref:DH domain-containing protein n=1 Tax=Aspergillus versicolor CBS 583.65 TaxID=1036611 RepID=A0A1L9PMA4_ASPVE|nr:uncharacterized protein ASPVEDRAFT_132573 [Aspergillus versicolor CBS 583.65]OJJ02623.1 hypothetical protein ASPVEDRAFT_132573 [Aspergillus versicolor CBS 583.65]
MELSIDSLVNLDLNSRKVISESDIIQTNSTEPDDEKLQFQDCVETTSSIDRVPSDRSPISSPFKRWVNSLRPRKTFEPQPYIEGWQCTSQENGGPRYLSPHQGSLEQQWEKSSGKSSHLGTIKTATMSITSQSVIRSRRTTQSTTNQSKSDIRNSIDSLRPTLTTSIDEEAQARATKRRQVLQEIITTESDYIFDLKALTNLLLMVSARPEIYYNVQSIREAHEKFLSRIKNLIPTYNLSRMQIERVMRPHAGDLSATAFPGRSLRTQNLKVLVDRRLKELASEANEALIVAREIGCLSKSFIYYKEFCENYELLTEDASILRKSIRNWQGFEQGLEALMRSTASIETRSLYSNKSLCLNDILIKDDPSAHDEIRRVLGSVRDLLAEINDATSTTLNRNLIEKTFFLQEMLDFKSITTVDIYKQLGPMTLCGVLHVTYRASTQPRQVTGAFMVCVLFKHHFFLARMNGEDRKLRPLACLYISDMRIDSLTNGKGYDYYCIFSWKLLFQLHDEKFELVLSASSAAEEKQWKTGILKSVAASVEVPNAISSEQRRFSFLVLDVVPEEEVPEFVPQLSRRPSLQTLGTTGMQRARSNLQAIIIRKTHCPHKHGQPQQIDGELERYKIPSFVSQPLTFMARRQDRIRLERVILHIYTRDALPYPGMFLATGELLFGSSSIMRHLSLRSKRYNRSSSINLPATLQNISEPQGIDEADEKQQKPNKRKRRDASDFSHSLDHDKGWTLHKDSALLLGRSKTMRVKNSPRTSYSPNSQPVVKVDKSLECSEVPLPRKGIWSIFNSMSLRRSKKNASSNFGGA